MACVGRYLFPPPLLDCLADGGSSIVSGVFEEEGGREGGEERVV